MLVNIFMSMLAKLTVFTLRNLNTSKFWGKFESQSKLFELASLLHSETDVPVAMLSMNVTLRFKRLCLVLKMYIIVQLKNTQK